MLQSEAFDINDAYRLIDHNRLVQEMYIRRRNDPRIVYHTIRH